MAEYRFTPPTRPHPHNEYALYISPTISVTERFRIAAHDLDMRPEDILGVEALLAPLKEKHAPTYEHCLRVGLVAAKIGTFLQEDARALLMAGGLHDAGKASVPVYLLEKTDGWTPQDSEAMAPHVIRGYELVRGRFDFSADILLQHHRFQPNGYPTEVPCDLHNYSFGTQTKIEHYGRIVALADVYDALHRINSRHGEKRAPTGQEIRELMARYNPDQRLLIDRLYQAGIFSTHIEGKPHIETSELDAHDVLHNECFRSGDGIRLPRNTRRAIQLAGALEPVPDKAGCTGRLLDISRHLKLEYFITSAINIGDAFEDMAHAIETSNTSLGLYKYAEQAQRDSKRNRRGGRVNHGIIELLTPIVAAQHLHDRTYSMGLDKILMLAHHTMSRTDRSDVDALIGLKNVAHQLSQYHDRKVPEHPSARNVLEYYEAELGNSEKPTSEAHNGEFVRGFPSVKIVTDILRGCSYPHFAQRVEEAYVHLRKYHGHEVGAGFLADCVAAGIYVSLSQDPKQRLVG